MASQPRQSHRQLYELWSCPLWFYRIALPAPAHPPAVKQKQRYGVMQRHMGAVAASSLIGVSLIPIGRVCDARDLASNTARSDRGEARRKPGRANRLVT